MRRRSLLRLYPSRWRQRYEEEVGAILDEEPLSVGVVFDLFLGAFDAHINPELGAPSLVGSTGSGQIPLAPSSPSGPAWGVVRLIGAVLVVVIVGLGLLYAYRAQAPAVPSTSFPQVLSEIQNGAVRSVTVEGSRVTVVLIDGRTEQTTVPSGDLVVRAVAERNQADPGHQIELRFSPASPDASVAWSIFLSFLPLILLVALIVLAASALARSRRPQRYELLARLGDLKDRGLVTQEEFEREKRRLLR